MREVVRRIAEQLGVLEADGERLATMDSMTLVLLATELEEATGVAVQMTSIFEPGFQTIDGVVAALVGAAPEPREARGPAYTARDVTHERATVPQEYFWYLDRDDHDPASYYAVYAFDIAGPLDEMLLAQSYRELVGCHGVYRTAFREIDGVLHQTVVPLAEARFTALEVSDRSAVPEARWGEELAQAATELAARGYDLATAEGLVRARLIRLAPDRQALVALFHHIAMDGGSITAFRKQLFAGYARLRGGASSSLLAPLPLQYIDVAAAQRTWADTPGGKAQDERWSALLRDAPPLELAGDFARDPIEARRDAAPLGITADASYPPERVDLPDDAHRAVLAAARANATTPFVVYLTGLAWLLHLRSGQPDIAIQAAYSSRIHDPALEDVHGCLTSWTTMRIDTSGSSGIATVIGRAKAVVEAVHGNGVPRDYYRRVPHGLRRAVFNYLPAPTVNRWQAADLTITRRPWPFPPWKRPWDLHLTLVDHQTSATLVWTGFRELFHRETVIALLERYVDILRRSAS